MVKNILTIIICLLLLAVMVSCSGVSKPNDSESGESLTEASKEYVIFCYPYSADQLAEEQAGEDIVIKDAAEKKFSFTDKTEIAKPADVEDSKTAEISGKTYSLEYKKTYETALSSSEELKNYGQYNYYIGDNVRMETRTATNELLSFLCLDENVLNATGNVNEAQAKEIAEAAVLSLYGENVKNEYTYDDTVHTDNGMEDLYIVVFRRYVFGIQSEDSIQIGVNKAGDVVSINAKLLGLFANAEKQITKEAVDKALATLDKSFANKWKTGVQTLVVDSEGDYYISAQLYRKGAEETETLLVYISVI